MSDQFLEQRINIKFCVKLGKNAHTCAMFFDAYEREDMKNPNIFEWYKRFKESSHVEITDKDNTHHCIRYEEYC
jgi:hypothetical protein